MSRDSVVSIIGWTILGGYWALKLSGVDLDERVATYLLGLSTGLFTANIIRG